MRKDRERKRRWERGRVQEKRATSKKKKRSFFINLHFINLPLPNEIKQNKYISQAKTNTEIETSSSALNKIYHNKKTPLSRWWSG